MSLFNISSDISQDIPAFSTTVCPSWFRQELFNNAKNITIIIILGFINAIVVAGNILVVLAVFASAKLRTVTNFLIVSLAISDLLVGLAVLPYSISLEVLEVWIFGELWCQMWLAVDVWLCTASILNLCAISIDRYLAITRPVHYRTIMSTMKVRLLIAAVWMLSFIICFPPLVGWNDRVQDSEEICALITNQGYVIYSALGSFYIPMLVMLFFYYRIYVVALKTSRALDRGFRTDGGGGSDVTLRIHRGRPTSESMYSGRSGNASRRPGDILVPRRIPTVVYHHNIEPNSPRCFREDSTRNHYTTKAAPNDSDSSPMNSRVRRTKSATPATSNRELEIEVVPGDHSVTDSPSAGRGNDEQRNGRSGNHNKSSKRNARWHAKRFRTEAKATKTVGIIVGGFILCWLPFFTVYLIMGFCETCIPEVLFKVFFYLGYCNSALNPIIYGIISKDFRAAFKKILFRCTFNDESVASLIRHIHMPTFTEEETHVGDSSSQT
ncbi:unnamed protein product [Larinioides sclopetarius]|uniref:G-protein coupled receptors family 1 profile domain-containing protein n=1 Tax=Larinioides sclopetarius TaxID=280406 RepID=A0AAV1ZR21_9ARAC